jgi:hypothetical protein
MTRQEMIERLRSHAADWDIIIVGGGATGVGVHLEGNSVPRPQLGRHRSETRP